MRRRRFTFKDAFHHVMNRGINGLQIFPDPSDKRFFLNLLYSKSIFYKIKIFSFCIMDNHYHIILQNSSNKLSDFMKQLNGIYATYFRKKYGGQGYVFQNRFKSTLIQDERYLKTVILYTLLNPIRANIVKSIFEYEWSSIHEYFNQDIKEPITDTGMVEDIFISKRNLLISADEGVKIEEKTTRYGRVIGDTNFYEEAKRKFERRKEQKSNSVRRRINDIGFKGREEVEKEFEAEENIKIMKIKNRMLVGKRLRIKLLVKLREESGLRYSEINKLFLFQDLKLGSLSVLYNRYVRKRI